MHISKPKKVEYILIALLGIIMIMSILLDTVFKQYIPEIFISRDDDLRGLMIVMYQVQASVSTVAIAVIAILSSLLNEVVNGVVVSKYILQMRPKILKHKTIIFTELILLAVNYVAVSYKFYNTIIGVFFICIILLLYMVNGIFIVFNGRNHIKEEIYNYIISNASYGNEVLKTEILQCLEKDISDAIESNSSYRTKEDLNILLDIFPLVFNEIKLNKEYKKYWEDLLQKIFQLLLNTSSNVLEKNKVYEYIHKTNKVLINKYDSSFNFEFWDRFSREYFKSISINNVRQYEDIFIYFSIRSDSYKTLVFSEKEERKNNYYLEYYSQQIFKCLTKNKNYGILTENDLARLKFSIFENIRNDISLCDDNKKVGILYTELLNYTKVLIDNFEKDIFRETFIEQITLNYSCDNKQLNYCYTIIIYLYYLSEQEKLVRPELKEFAKKLISDNANEISDFLYSDYDRAVNNKESINYFRRVLDNWEIMPEKEAKFVIMDSCITMFLIYNSLFSERNIIRLNDKLEMIIQGDSFSTYNQYLGKNRLNSKNTYKRFVQLFYRHKIDDEEIDNAISRLESSISYIYKISEIVKSEKQNVNLESKISTEMKLLNKTKATINDILSSFTKNKPKSECNIQTFKFSCSTFSYFLNENDLDIYINSMRTKFISLIIGLILKHLNYKELSFKEKDFLNVFFELLEMSETEVNTLIGYKNWFYGVNKEDDFRLLEERMNKIYDSNLSNVITAINSKMIYINAIKSSVKISQVDVDSIIKDLDKNEEDLYLYNITNDIYLPFCEDELKVYIQNTKVNIEFEITFEYLIYKKIIGIAVIDKR